MAKRNGPAWAAIAAIVVTVVAPTVPVAAQAAPTFSDVPAGYWAAPEISSLAAAGILQGVGDGRFAPEGPVTRAQWATMLDRVEKAPSDAVGPKFGDVAPSDWFFAGVQGTAGLDWMVGTGAEQFSPSDPVSRAMAATSVARVLGLAHVADDEAGTALPYSDAAAVPAWAQGPVAVAAHLGLLIGDAGRFLPADTLTRAQAAVLLSRLQAVGPQQLQDEGARVATTVHVMPDAGTVETGGHTAIHAYAHDAAGYLVPARFAWSAQGGATAPGTASTIGGLATFTAGGPGSATVVASVVGGKASGSVAVAIDQAASLSVSPVPPAVLSSAPLPLSVQVLSSAGGVDAGADGVIATATASGASGAGPVTATVRLQNGAGTLTVPALPPGAYTLTVSAMGLTPVAAKLQSVTAPLGALQLKARNETVATVGIGGTMTVDATVQAPNGQSVSGTWPLTVTVSGDQTALSLLTGERLPPPTLQVQTASATLPSAGGPAAILAGNAAGTGAVALAVPGGALAPATMNVQVTQTAAFGTAGAVRALAGQPATVTMPFTGQPGSGAPVYAEPIDPAGHPQPYVQASVAGGMATATFTPTLAGVWTLRWRGGGATPVQSGSLTVAPGAPTQLVVDPVPTSVLLPGQQATLKAWVGDQFGNAIATPFSLQAVTGGDAAAGNLALGAKTFAGPGAIGTFSAGTNGTAVLTFSSPDHPSLPAATVLMRTVVGRADRVAGKGGWIMFPDWRTGSDAQLLDQARAEGWTHLYLEVATTSDGLYGLRALDDLLPKAHAAGIAVIAWVYAGLEDPAGDTAIVKQVAQYATPSGDRVDGVALDLEEVLTPDVVSAYTAAANAAEGPAGLVVAVPYPPAYGPSTPWTALAPNVQVIAPMDYWHVQERDYSYSEVYHWVADSIQKIRAQAGADMPVEVIAETFDEFNVKGIYSPTSAELQAAMQAAADAGGVGVSFYRPVTATAPELAVMQQPWPAP